jgi:hypothetical protein
MSIKGTPVIFREAGVNPALDENPIRGVNFMAPLVGCLTFAIIGCVGFTAFALWNSMKASASPASEVIPAIAQSPTPTETLDDWSLTGTAMYYGSQTPTATNTPTPTATATLDDWSLTGTALYFQTFTPTATFTATATLTPQPTSTVANDELSRLSASMTAIWYLTNTPTPMPTATFAATEAARIEYREREVQVVITSPPRVERIVVTSPPRVERIVVTSPPEYIYVTVQPTWEYTPPELPPGMTIIAVSPEVPGTITETSTPTSTPTETPTATEAL